MLDAIYQLGEGEIESSVWNKHITRRQRKIESFARKNPNSFESNRRYLTKNIQNNTSGRYIMCNIYQYTKN